MRADEALTAGVWMLAPLMQSLRIRVRSAGPAARGAHPVSSAMNAAASSADSTCASVPRPR